MSEKESKMKAKIIVNGNCMLCKKELNGDRIFFCKECEKKAKEKEKEIELAYQREELKQMLK